jgi:GNAT superfamily N-acetyltransferase
MEEFTKISVTPLNMDSVMDTEFPDGISFFSSFLSYYAREVLEVGGEAFVSKDAENRINGLFIYDQFEKTGTVFTNSRAVFNLFYGFRQHRFLFSEVMTEFENEPFDIYSMNLANYIGDHRFRHEVEMAEENEIEEIERFMAMVNPGMNPGWVRVAIHNGDRCFISRLGDEIAGLGWLSKVNGVGRLHSLFVSPKFRGMGIGTDLLNARLFWLRASGTKWVFSEISQFNVPSARIAAKGGMKKTGVIYLYFRKV